MKTYNIYINIVHRVFVGLSLLSCVVETAAQNSPRTLQDCIDIALKNNLLVRAGAISVEKAQNMQGAAFDIDKTQFALGQDPTSGGSPDNSISLTQSMDFPTVYVSRRKYLKAETELQRSNLAVVRNDLIRDVYVNYYTLLHVRERVRIIQRQDSVCTRFLFLAKTKYKEGEAGRLELINAERMYNENRIALQKEQNAERKVQFALHRLLNIECDVNPTENDLPVLPAPVFRDSVNFAQTPQGSVYENRKHVSERSLKLARQGYMPNISLTLKNQLVIKGFNPYNIQRDRFEQGNFMGFEVGVGIPVFFGATRAKTKAARSDVEIAELQRREGELAMQNEYAACVDEYQRAKQALAYYDSEGTASAAELGRLSQLSYETGEIGYVEYIQNLRSAVETSLLRADVINDYNQAIILLNHIQGYK